MHDDLLRWFRRHARDLPWRRERSPYRTWISEVMLQQTRVDTVVPYFERFVAAFPDATALAAAPLERVLKLWEGLGYYRRARYLHAAAREVAAAGGALPESAAELRRLPGFGPYTAAAVASLAFGERLVAVDGNVRRVAARLFALERPSPAAVARRLAPLQPHAEAGAFNEALIELGALVCTPRAPACERCPLAERCAARALGAPEAFPDDPPRRPVPTRRRLGLLHLDRGTDDAPRVWLRRRGLDELLPGLWGVPQMDADGDAVPGARLEPVRHVYSHFRLELTPVRVDAKPPGSEPVGAAQLAELPLSVVDRKVLAAARAAGWPLPAGKEGA